MERETRPHGCRQRKLIRRKQELQDESRKRSDKLQEALAVLNNELQKALGKEKDYQNKNIEEIIERSSKKEEWKNRQVGLLEEQRILPHNIWKYPPSINR